jgi:hypothetical protein
MARIGAPREPIDGEVAKNVSNASGDTGLGKPVRKKGTAAADPNGSDAASLALSRICCSARRSHRATSNLGHPVEPPTELQDLAAVRTKSDRQ